VVLVGFKPDLRRPTGFLQCFDTVGLVIWPVKIVLEMTYNVLSGTLSLYNAICTCYFTKLTLEYTVLESHGKQLRVFCTNTVLSNMQT